MKILITGGTGFVGQRLLAALDKHHLIVLTRKPEDQPQKSNIAYHRWDALSGEKIPPEFLEGVDGIVNLMGENLAAKRWTSKQKEKLELSRIAGTRALVNSLEEHLSTPLKVFISAGAIGYYPVNLEETLTEQTPPGETYLAKLCSEWENEAKKLGKAQRKVHLRIGVVLERGGGALSKMLPPFRLGLGGPFGSGKQIVPWIHLDDLVHIIVSALEDTRYQGIYNAVSPHPVSNCELSKTLGQLLSRPAILPFPAMAAKILMGEMATIVLDSQKVIPQRLIEQEHRFLYPNLEGALKQILGC